MKLKKIILLLALGHGLNDLVAGYFLGGIVKNPADLIQAAAGLIIYNLLAFGGQYPVALLLERSSSPKKFLLIAFVLNIISVLLSPVAIQFSIVLTGLASALYHVAGGTICAGENKATNIGLFAAPGVAGLIAGGYFAYANIAADTWLLVFAILFTLVLFRAPIPHKENFIQSKANKEKEAGSIIDQHDIIMILLLAIISLRSVIWNVFQLIHENNYYWLLAIAASAFAGKIAGGWLADRIGWRLYMISSLVIATPLITVFKKEIILFCIGIGILQSGIPATTAILIQSMKGKTERAIGLSFGLTIIAGAVIFYTPVRNWLLSDMSIFIIAATIFVLMYQAIRQNKGLPGPVPGF